jgi:hypothetical protein
MGHSGPCLCNRGSDPAYKQAAASLGRTLADQGIRLVYGGGHFGLMGAVADGVLGNGGTAHGVITESLRAKEIAHTGLTSLRVVETMRERKAAMADAADAFIMSWLRSQAASMTRAAPASKPHRSNLTTDAVAQIDAIGNMLLSVMERWRFAYKAW